MRKVRLLSSDPFQHKKEYKQSACIFTISSLLTQRHGVNTIHPYGLNSQHTGNEWLISTFFSPFLFLQTFLHLFHFCFTFVLLVSLFVSFVLHPLSDSLLFTNLIISSSSQNWRIHPWGKYRMGTPDWVCFPYLNHGTDQRFEHIAHPFLWCWVLVVSSVVFCTTFPPSDTLCS